MWEEETTRALQGYTHVLQLAAPQVDILHLASRKSAAAKQPAQALSGFVPR